MDADSSTSGDGGCQWVGLQSQEEEDGDEGEHEYDRFMASRSSGWAGWLMDGWVSVG